MKNDNKFNKWVSRLSGGGTQPKPRPRIRWTSQPPKHSSPSLNPIVSPPACILQSPISSFTISSPKNMTEKFPLELLSGLTSPIKIMCLPPPPINQPHRLDWEVPGSPSKQAEMYISFKLSNANTIQYSNPTAILALGLTSQSAKESSRQCTTPSLKG